MKARALMARRPVRRDKDSTEMAEYVELVVRMTCGTLDPLMLPNEMGDGEQWTEQVSSEILEETLRWGERERVRKRGRETLFVSLSFSLTVSLAHAVPLRSRSLFLSFFLSYPWFSTAKGSCLRFSDAISARSCATTRTTRLASCACRRRPSAVVLVSVPVAVVVLLHHLLPLPLLLLLLLLLPPLLLLFRSRSRLVALPDYEECASSPGGYPARQVRRGPGHALAEGAKILGHTTQ